jgi:hypothetical protein
MERGCLVAILVGVILASGSCATMAGVDLANGGGESKTEPSVLVGIMVFSVGVLVACGSLLWRMLRPTPSGSGASRPARTDADREREVLRLAEIEHGRLTVTETAARCDLTIAEAKEALDRLAAQQAAEIQVTQNGVLVYVFPGFLSDDDKSRARDF